VARRVQCGGGLAVHPAPGLDAFMPEPYADTLVTLAAGRAATVARLRTIAARVEALPLESAAEVLVLVEPAVARWSGRRR
jgi:hypothetical protein